MSQGMAAFIASLRALEGLAEATAREAAPLVEAAAKKTAAAGTDPDGKPWPKTAKGAPALVNAAAHVTARANGPVVTLDLTGPEVFHAQAAAGRPARKVIPDGSNIPTPIAAALQEGAARAFRKLMGAA